jgi:hypothetical protein
MNNNTKELFRKEVVPELLKKAKTLSLRKCRCNIRFDVTTIEFKVHDKINYHRTHIINPKTNKFFVLCERCRTKQQEFKEKNREHAREVNKIYLSKSENKERHKAHQQTEQYKEGRKEYNKEYRSKPEVKERMKEYSKEYKKLPEVKSNRNERQMKDYYNDIAKRFRQTLSRSLNHKLKLCLKGGESGDKNTMEYLGCSMEEFIKHIEDQFEEGMSWENYGRIEDVRCWHLDHRVPAFYKENEDDEITKEVIIERSHYTNFQPMWEDENISKGNKYVGKYIQMD